MANHVEGAASTICEDQFEEQNPQSYYEENSTNETRNLQVKPKVENIGIEMSFSQTFTDFAQKKLRANEMKDKFLTTGCKYIDDFLKGGVPTFGMTEFVGPAGNGKTQLALQLSLTVQLPEDMGGLNSGAVYINTESAFPSNRLVELIKEFKVKYPEKLPDNPMDNIHVEQIHNADALVECVTKRLPNLIMEKTIGIIMVDSIAGAFRSEFEETSSYQLKRSNDLKLIGRTLHDIAHRNGVALVVLNQVTTLMESMSTNGFCPALGMTWRNFVTTRILFLRRDEGRFLEVNISPYIPVRQLIFDIGSDGLSALKVNA